MDGVEVLHDIDLHVAPGETIAFVANGRWQQQMTSLLSRLYEVTAELSRLRGHDLRKIKRKSLARQMGIVVADPYLFGSIRENILSDGRTPLTKRLWKPQRLLARMISSHG